MKPILLFIVSLLLCSGSILRAQELPKALILGDTVYNGLSGTVTTDLKGLVKVVWKHPGSSMAALAQLDQLLGSDTWSVIHFNFGLADLHYRDPSTKSIRLLSRETGGVRVTPPDQYEKNLLDIVKRLKSTGAKLIWANTTPILASGPLYDAGSEVEYNAIAARIMTANGIPINDMNTFATAMLLNTKGDPSPLFSRIPLQPPIVRNILRALNLKAEPKDWPVAPGKHKTTVRRESRNPVQTTMITAAETAQPPNEVLAATGNNVWWNEERLNIRIPRALTSDALAYYSDQVGNFSKQAIKSHAEPFSQLDYNATVELHKEFKQGDKTFTDVHVVTLKLSFAQYFSSTPADGMHFQKERVVILDAGGKVLHIAGDGPTNVHILSI